MIKYRTVNVEGIDIFYREAGDPEDPTLLLLHGFPTSSHMFHNLLPAFADDFHLVAPDYQSFGNSDCPPREEFEYTFDHSPRWSRDSSTPWTWRGSACTSRTTAPP